MTVVTVVPGLSDEQLTDFEVSAEALMVAALQAVADQVADQIARIQIASAAPVRSVWDGCPYGFHATHIGPCPGGGLLVLVAADPPAVPDIPGPPGQPFVSPDDLSQITPLWAGQVQQQLMPVVAEVYQTSGSTVYAQLVGASGMSTLPPVSPLAAEQYLATARQSLTQVGNDLWENARSSMLDGFQQGESIPELAARVRGAAQMTAPTAVMVARTTVLDASNAGSIGTARASGLALRKGWFSTPDARTRPSHVTAGHTYGDERGFIPLADTFQVGGYSCDRPHDPELPIAERARCRCTIGYGVSDRSATPVRQAQAPPLPGQSGDVPDLPALPPVPTPPAAQAAFDRALAQAAAAEARALVGARNAYGRAVRLAQQAYVRRLAVAGRQRAAAERALARDAARDARRVAETSAREARRTAERAARDARDAAVGRPGPVPAIPGPGPGAAGRAGAVAVRPVLRAARTRDELAVAMRAEMRRITDREVVVEIPPDASMASMREFYEGVLTSAEQFPDTQLRSISWFMRRDGHYAEADAGDLLVNQWWFSQSRRPALLSRVRADVAGWDGDVHGWMPRGAGSVDALGRHEYGHVVHLSLGVETRAVSSRALTIVERHAAVEQVKPADLVARDLGAYATSDELELVAGAYTDVAINGDAAALVSREIVDELAAAYRRSGGTPGTAPTPAARAFAAPARSVAQLRAAVKAKGVTVPAGLRTPALRTLADDLDRGVPPATARETAVQTVLAERRVVAEVLGDVDQALVEQASARSLAFFARQVDQLPAEVKAGRLATALRAGDVDAARAEVARLVTGSKLKAAGKTADVVPLDRTSMTVLGDAGQKAGTLVTVVRPGYATTFEGRTLVLSRASVQPATPAQIAARTPVKAVKKAAPAKAAREAAGPVMTRAEADRWARDSAIRIDLQHGTTPTSAAEIQRTGFDIGRQGSKTDLGNLGAGFYFNPAGAPSYGQAAGYGATLTARVRVGKVMFTSSEDYARARAVEDYIDILHTLGPAQARRYLDSAVVRTTVDDRFMVPAGTTNRELIGPLTDEQVARYLALRQEGRASGFVLRERAIDDGYGAIVLDTRTPVPGFYATNGRTWLEVNVLRADDIAVIAPRAAKAAVKKAAPAKKAAAPKAPPAPETELSKAIDLDLAGVPKPVLARWVRTVRDPGSSTLTEHARRFRQEIIDKRRTLAEALTEVDELLGNGASAATLTARGAARLRRVEAALEGWPELAELRKVVTAMGTGDPRKIRAAVKAAQRKTGLSQVGPDAGSTARMSDGMTPLGGAKIPDGATVTVVRPGYTVDVGEQKVVLSRPVVEVTSPVEALPRTAVPTPARAGAEAKAVNPSFGATNTGPTYPQAPAISTSPKTGKVISRRYTEDLGPVPSGAFEENCTNAVLAWDMRMRGFDVTAAPLDILDRAGYAAGRTFDEIEELITSAYRLPNGAPHGRSFASQKWRSFDEIEAEILRDWPGGGRGFITVGKHVFSVMKRNGKMEFVEAQFDANASRIVTALYRKKYKSSGFLGDIQEGKVIRLDDLVPAEGILDAVRPA